MLREAIVLTTSVLGILWMYKKFSRKSQIRVGFAGLIGNTPMVLIQSLSDETGCRILCKCEYLNPGGSSKDRIGKHMIVDAENKHLLPKGGTVVEGTSGSTGISLAQMCNTRGYECIIVMPNDQAKEKLDALDRLGAVVKLVPPASIMNSEHYVNVARKIAASIPGAFFTNQFENLANFQTHFETTGPEIWEQTDGVIDAFVMSAGTGGTIGGVSKYLKSQSNIVRVVLADPQGSSLYYKVNKGVLYTAEQSERTIRKHRYDTITEGIGIDRLTANFAAAEPYIDYAVRITDQEVVTMAMHLSKNDGLFVGSSSALNVCAAVKVAKDMGPGHTIVTVLCGSGSRELSKLYNPEYLKSRGLSLG